MQRNRPRICPFSRILEFVPMQGSVLDVGCGDGLFLGLLSQLGDVQGIGFDISAAAVTRANAMAKRIDAGKPVRYLHVTPDSEWPSGPFDVVSIIDVLHHVTPESQQHVIEMSAARVRRGGILIYKDIAAGVGGMMNRLHDFVVARERIHYVKPETVMRWAEGVSLKLEHFEDIRRLWYPHQLLVFRRK